MKGIDLNKVAQKRIVNKKILRTGKISYDIGKIIEKPRPSVNRDLFFK